MSAAYNPVEKSAHTRISLYFFSIYTVGGAHLLNSTFDNMPIFTNRSSPLFISSVATNGTYRFFLKMGRVFSFCSNFSTFAKTSWKFLGETTLIFSASPVMHSTFWQNVLIGWYQRLNFWNQSNLNKFSVYLIFSKFVSLLLIDQSQSLTENLPTYLVLWLYLRTTLCDSFSLFVCLTLFLIIFLFLHCDPICPNL